MTPVGFSNKDTAFRRSCAMLMFISINEPAQGGTSDRLTADASPANMRLKGDTVMAESYSKPEIDTKLALVEERLDHKFDRLLAEIKEGFMSLDNRFSIGIA